MSSWTSFQDGYLYLKEGKEYVCMRSQHVYQLLSDRQPFHFAATLLFYYEITSQIYIIIKNFEMKQTVRTTNNYNAVIQIPYQKLAKKSNCVKLNNNQQRSNTSKTIVVPQCHGCYQKPQPNVSMQMLEELERMYDTDMKQKQTEIINIQNRLSDTERQLTENKNQIQKCKQKSLFEQQTASKNIRDKDEQIARLGKQLEASKLQKQTLMRTKIAEVQNNILSSQKLEREKYQKYLEQLQKKKKEQLDNLGLTHQADKDKLKQEHLLLKVSIQQLKAEHQRQKLQVQKQLYQVNLKNSYLQKTLQELKNKDKQNTSLIQTKQSTIKQRVKRIQELEAQALNQVQEINEKLQVIKTIESKILLIQSQNSTLKENFKNAEYDRNQLSLKRKESDNLLGQYRNRQTSLLKQVEDLTAQVIKLQNIMKEKDNPKVYQVKIQKVIDRQEYIHSLETQLEAERRNRLQLEEDIKKLKLFILQKQKQIKEKGSKIGQLQQTIVTLKLYIEQKEKSFAWIVQRQITKDIDINKGQANKTYKVFPSEPKIYYQFKSEGTPQPIRIGQDQRIVIEDHTVTIQNRTGEINISTKRHSSREIGEQIQE